MNYISAAIYEVAQASCHASHFSYSAVYASINRSTMGFGFVARRSLTREASRLSPFIASEVCRCQKAYAPHLKFAICIVSGLGIWPFRAKIDGDT